MARRYHSVLLETRSSRLQLPIAKKPVFVRAGTGIGLGYRRNREGAGTWVVRVADGRGANWTKRFAIADDYDGAGLDYWQAQAEAQAISRRAGLVDENSGEPVTVLEAINAYEQQLKTRGGDLGNVTRLRSHLPPGLGDKRVSELTAGALRGWRDGLMKQLAPATVNRTSTVLKAALNAAAETDSSVSTRRAWESGLASIADAEEARNVILADDEVRLVIAASYRQSDEFGLFVEVAAITGGRPSQLRRAEVQDLQGDRPDPRIMMPTSHKGRGKKKVGRRPVPIPATLARRLVGAGKGRRAMEPLLLKPGGLPWKKSDHSRLFRRAAIVAGLDPSEVTIYALRHSSIVRQLLGGTPVRVVAVNHDTSVAMLERTYSRHIGDHSDALARVTLLDVEVTANVVKLRADVSSAA